MRLKINQLSTLLGLSHTTIIYYEKRNLIHPIRLENGYREYSFDDIMTLKKVIVLRNLGLSSGEIEQVLEEPSTNYENLLISQSKKIKENIQQELKVVSLIDELLTMRPFEFEIVQMQPFYITKKPSCNTDHTIISDDKAAKELIRSMPVSFFHWFINTKDVTNLDFDRINQGLDMTYRGIRLDDALMRNMDTFGLDLIPSQKCLHVIMSFADVETYIKKLNEYMLSHPMNYGKQIILRSSTLNTVLYDKEKSESYGEIFVPIEP